MKFLTAITLLLAATVAKAEVYSCSFTEPFFSISIDSATGMVTRTEPDWESETGEEITTVVSTDASVMSTMEDGIETLYVVPKGQPAIMRLALTWQGSDGMSDMIFPYDGQLLSPDADSHANHLLGGCESTSKKARMPDGMEE